MELPHAVSATLDTFLGACDEAAPGLVEGLLLHGALGFGEFFAGQSDIDAVVLLSRRAGPADLVALEAAHRATAKAHPAQTLEAVHLLTQDLQRPPAACPDVPAVHEHVLEAASRFEVNPVTWHELAGHGITLRGTPHADLGIWTDDAALRAFTARNLSTYWAAQRDEVTAHPDEASAPWVSAWVVLGVARLHHLLATGAMTTKSGAGRYALDRFDDRWHAVVRDALVVREQGDRPPPLGDGSDGRRGREVAAFAAMVVDDGLALPHPPV
ncbi:MAG TPA: aminoglycoside adenylyltransferase domain-containing protein [Actinomycetales bacterium]